MNKDTESVAYFKENVFYLKELFVSSLHNYNHNGTKRRNNTDKHKWYGSSGSDRRPYRGHTSADNTARVKTG